MERLTKRYTDATLGAFMACAANCINEDFDCNDCVKLDEIIARLAAYEDTGLEPNEIRSLLQTDTGGLYKKLPCREGDPVWWIDVDWLPGNGPMFHKIASGKFRYAMLDWQNPIYTSQAEAESALAEMAKGAGK